MDASPVSDTSIRLVLSDVDGTLVTPDKDLTDEAVRAVKELRECDILFAITSSRPPRGLSMLIDPLDIATPMGGFNGGLIVDTHLQPLSQLTIKAEIVGPIIDILASNGLSVWTYQGEDWFVLDLDAPHVARESRAVQFHPTQVKSFDTLRTDIVKIVGVSDDPELIAKATRAVNADYAKDVSATSSQSYYLDITNWRANKGAVVDYLSDHLSIDRRTIVTIGDGGNDVSMFERSGISIAMGNATDEVKARATHVTRANNDNGFAYAIEHFVLDSAR
jgi:hypothetical protein